MYRIKHENVIKTIFYGADFTSCGLHIMICLYGFHAISINKLTSLHWFNWLLAA